MSGEHDVLYHEFCSYTFISKSSMGPKWPSSPFLVCESEVTVRYIVVLVIGFLIIQFQSFIFTELVVY